MSGARGCGACLRIAAATGGAIIIPRGETFRGGTSPSGLGEGAGDLGGARGEAAGGGDARVRRRLQALLAAAARCRGAGLLVRERRHQRPVLRQRLLAQPALADGAASLITSACQICPRQQYSHRPWISQSMACTQFLLCSSETRERNCTFCVASFCSGWRKRVQAVRRLTG